MMIKSSIAVYRNAYLGLSGATWWLALVMFVNRAGTMVLPFMTVYLREEMHFSIAQAGWEIAFFGSGAVLGNFIGGRLTDKFGFYQVQFWSLFFNGILFIVLGQMQTFWRIAACMFVIGAVGEAFRPANATAIAHYSSPENRTRSYSLNRLAINLGFSIGPAVGGLLAYRYLFWADGLTCLVAAILLRVALPPIITTKRKQNLKTNKIDSSVWKDRVYLKFTFFIFLSALCFLQMFSLLPVFYKEQLKFTQSEVGLVVALIAMVTITVGEMLMFPFINTFWVSRSNEHNRGQYASLFSMSFAFAHVLAPTFGSQVVQYSNYHILWYIVFGLCIIASIGFYSF